MIASKPPQSSLQRRLHRTRQDCKQQLSGAAANITKFSCAESQVRSEHSAMSRFTCFHMLMPASVLSRGKKQVHVLAQHLPVDCFVMASASKQQFDLGDTAAIHRHNSAYERVQHMHMYACVSCNFNLKLRQFLGPLSMLQECLLHLFCACCCCCTGVKRTTSCARSLLL